MAGPSFSEQRTPPALLSTFVWRITASHMTSYFILGWLASTVLDYRSAFASGALAGYMLDFGSPWVAAGPALQVVRGVLFGLVLWPAREPLLGQPHGVWRLWILFVGLAIWATDEYEMRRAIANFSAPAP